MKVTMIECDHPLCHNTDYPEEGGKKDATPYGWLEATVCVIGLGDTKMACCSAACLHATIDHKLEGVFR